jgi:predicted component of type VI protein secretion system
MKKIAVLLALLGLGAFPALAANAATFNNVTVIDVKCSTQAAANPDAHKRTCALGCEKSGYGILTSDKKFLKLDAAGNSEIAKELKASHRKDHLRVNVNGEVEGNTLKVSSIKLL